MPKARKPVADYITFEQFKKMLDKEPDEMYRLLYRVYWSFMLRVSEAVGQSEADINQIKKAREERKKVVDSILSDPKKLQAYKDSHNGKIPRIGEHRWVKQLPGIRPCDIDAQRPPKMKADHTLRVWRKHGQFKIMPFNDKQLYADLTDYIKRNKIGPEDRIFPVYRQEVLDHMNDHGYTIGGQTKIHPHSLRRGGGIHYRTKGGKLEVLQVVYSHKKMSQTLDYIGLDETAALNEFAGVKMM